MTRAAQVLGNVLNEHSDDAKDQYRGHNARAAKASVRQALDLYAALHKYASYYSCDDFYCFDSNDAFPVASRLVELAIQTGEISPARGNELLDAVGAFWRERPSF
jgi:hypothetical protein